MAANSAQQSQTTMRAWASRLVSGCNIVMFAVLIALFVGRGATLVSPWDGPAIATVALAAATLILAAVALGVGLLAVWGYATLREHAENIARIAADAAARPAADEAAKRVVSAWLSAPDGADGDAVANAYGRE